MDLSDRKKKILRAIVDSYIQTAEPVGSKAIAAMPDMDFSSATIRNEMAELTTMGYLEQPHTSAGRVPSAAGYRLYVDELMQGYRLSVDETKSLKEAMDTKLRQFDDVIAQVGRMVSQITNLPAYAVAAPKAPAATVRHFEILGADEHSFILVVLTNAEVVKNRLVKLPVKLSEQDLKLLSAVLNASLTDLTADEITPEVMNRVSRSAGAAASLVPIIVDYTVHVLQEQQQSEVYITGQTRLLGQPEYRDVEKAQEVINSLDEETIANLPAPIADGPVQVLVGPENIARELRDTSVVMTRFDIGDGMQGMIGVVGPTRMDYARVTARLSYFAEGLGRMFGKGELPSTKEEPSAPEDGEKAPDGENKE